jgi:hypothetical protein
MFISLVKQASRVMTKRIKSAGVLQILTHLQKWCRDRHRAAVVPYRAGGQQVFPVEKGRLRKLSWILTCGYIHRDFKAETHIGTHTGKTRRDLLHDRHKCDETRVKNW